MAGLPPRVGVLLPSVNTVLEQELPSAAAAAATFHFHRLDLEAGSDRDALEAMAASAPAAAALLATARSRKGAEQRCRQRFSAFSLTLLHAILTLKRHTSFATWGENNP